MHTLKFRLAENRDIPQLLNMINRAYREPTESSWSNEAAIISGDRIHQHQLEQLLIRQQHSQMDAQLLVAELNTQAHDEMVGCVALTYSDLDAEIGTYCIDPAWQAFGFGQQVLHTAEVYAVKQQPKLKTLSMWVLDVRSELIAFYERRGYVQTGNIADYPVDEDVGQPLVELKIIEMQKHVQTYV